MNVEERIEGFSRLGDFLLEDEKHIDVFHRAKHMNSWFSLENISFAIAAISRTMLKRENLEFWLSNYDLSKIENPKKVALVLAGNIPAVGFHDILCVLILGHSTQIKLSSKDAVLIKYLLDNLIRIEPRFEGSINFVDRVADFDAIITTGSNNTAIHFEHYFSKYPHIIRKNRKSIAIISADFNSDDIRLLSEDLFRHFGLGCRNVSKLYIHDSIKLTSLMEVLHEEKSIILHNKYKNNYDYNYTLLLMNGDEFLMNASCLLLPDKSLHSRIATIHYERYGNDEDLLKSIEEIEQDIQCIVSKSEISDLDTVHLGKAQNPGLMDYADHIDTIEFLLNI